MDAVVIVPDPGFDETVDVIRQQIAHHRPASQDPVAGP
jgi:hypothetical protein